MASVTGGVLVMLARLYLSYTTGLGNTRIDITFVEYYWKYLNDIHVYLWIPPKAMHAVIIDNA